MLITGPAGSAGIAARTIHQWSFRATPLHRGSAHEWIGAGEEELFGGHGGVDRTGLSSKAHGGTLFT